MRIFEKIPTAVENQSLQALIANLKIFESVSKMLQSGGGNRVDLHEARSLFDKLVADFGEVYPLTHIRRDADIINNPHFENAIIKILDDREAALTIEEKEASAIFLKNPDNDEENNDVDDGDDDALGYAAQILRNTQQRKRARAGTSDYRSVRHVSSTTNIVERLFGKAKHIMTALRRKMDPSSLNMLLFLKANRKLWPNASIVQKILNARAALGLREDDDALALDGDAFEEEN